MKQRQSLKEAGSFFNYMMSNNNSVPKKGEWATELLFTDRHVYLIDTVSPCMKKVRLQRVHTKAGAKADGMGHQDWEHTPIPNDFVHIVYRYGSWYRVSEDFGKKLYSKIRILFGVARYYYDWSF